MLPRLSTLSRCRALAAKSVPCGRTKPRDRLGFSTPTTLTSERRDWKLAEDWRDDQSLPRESRLFASVLEPWEAEDAVERHRESSELAAEWGTAGTASGEGDSQRKEGGRS